MEHGFNEHGTLRGMLIRWRALTLTRAGAVLLLALLSSTWLSVSWAAAAPAPVPAPASKAAVTKPSTSNDHNLLELGPGDSVAMQVYGQPDMTSTVYVGDDGTVNLPLVGAVKVTGLTAVLASRRIEKALKDGQFLVDPHVTLTIVQSHSQRVSVVGEVHSPGRYALEANTSLIDLLAQAGGTTENSASVVYVVHTDTQGNTTRRSVDLNAFAGQGNGTLPTEILHGGDSVFVPRAETFTIYGEVSAPNQYRLEPGMTVIQAVARAGGVTPRGSERRIDIKRKGPDGQYVTTHAKSGDLVQADDVIRIKERIF